MKAALMNQNTLPFVDPPSGPLAGAPVASAGNKDMWYQSTDFGLCKYVSVFKNAGADFIDCGRPALVSNIEPTDSYTICGCVRVGALSAPAIVCAIGAVSPGTDRQVVLRVQVNRDIVVNIGGVDNIIAANFPVDTWARYCVSNSVAQSRAFINGVQVGGNLNRGAFVSPLNFYIGALNGDTSFNMEGDTATVSIGAGYSADGSMNGVSMIDRFDMNKWDGSTSGKSDMGYTYAVTKATPFTELSYACVPVSFL